MRCLRTHKDRSPSPYVDDQPGAQRGHASLGDFQQAAMDVYFSGISSCALKPFGLNTADCHSSRSKLLLSCDVQTNPCDQALCVWARTKQAGSEQV